METILNISPWLSIGAFIIALVSLRYSIRKQKFDEEMATSDQTAILLSKIGDAKVLLTKQHDMVSKLRAQSIKCATIPADIFDLLDESIDSMEKMLDLDMGNICFSKPRSYRQVKLMQGQLDAQASVLSSLISNVDETLKKCEVCPVQINAKQQLAARGDTGSPQPQPQSEHPPKENNQ